MDSDELTSMDDLFLHSLQSMYYMETHLVDALDSMSSMAKGEKISQAFDEHRKDTEEHVDRLEQVFEKMGKEPQEGKNPVMDALEKDKKEHEDLIQDAEMLDLFYLGAGLKTEHIEMSAYNELIELAKKLEKDDEIIALLKDNYSSEEQARQKLESLATGS